MITYTVKFQPGRYKITEKQAGRLFNQRTYLIGREDDGTIVGWTFEENHAKQICYALNLAWATLSGDNIEARALTQQLEKLRSH